MPSTAIEDIHCATQKVQGLIALVLPVSSTSSMIDAKLFAGLLESMGRANQWLGVRACEVREVDLEKEIAEYRQNLERLGQLLPTIQGKLLIEKARLQQARLHLEGAVAWTQARKKTL